MIQLIFKTKKRFRRPEKNRILVYEYAVLGLDQFLMKYKPAIIYPMEQEINIYVLFISVVLGKFNRQGYLDTYIKIVAPEIIITSLDNSYLFYSIKNRHPHRKTVFVQNGFRGYAGDIFELLESGQVNTKNLRVDYKICMGKNIANQYSLYLDGNSFVAGHLKNNYIPKRKTKINGIGLISQYRDFKEISIGGRNYSHTEFYGTLDKMLLSLLKTFSCEKQTKFYIITTTPRSNNQVLENEKRYFMKMWGEEKGLEFYEGDSYEAVDSLSLVVVSDSTLGYESAARGNKTVFFSARGRLNELPGYDFGWPGKYPDTGPYWTNIPEPEIFHSILESVFKMSDSDYQKLLINTEFEKNMQYDPDNLCLRDYFEREILHL